MMRKISALPIVVIAFLSQVAGCASIDSALSKEPFKIYETHPPFRERLNLLAPETEHSAIDSNELLAKSIRKSYVADARFWTLVSVDPQVMALDMFTHEDWIVGGTLVEKGGELVYPVIGKNGKLYKGSYNSHLYFTESDLREEVGHRVYALSTRALGVTLLDNDDFYFEVFGIGDLRARWRSLEEVPITPESGVAFKYTVDQSGKVRTQNVTTDTQAKADAYSTLIDQLKLRYIGGSAPHDKSSNTVHSGTLHIEQTYGPMAVNATDHIFSDDDFDVDKYIKTGGFFEYAYGKSHRFGDYKADLLAYRTYVSSMESRASRYEEQRTQQREALAAEKRREEAAREAKIKREKLAAKRQEAERERQAYLATPKGRAETAARLAREKEQARLHRVARAAERAKWPSGAVGKLSRGALVCTSVKGAAVASAYGGTNKHCDSVFGDRFISSMYDSGHGRNIKSVKIIGGGQWYVNGSDIEQ